MLQKHKKTIITILTIPCLLFTTWTIPDKLRVYFFPPIYIRLLNVILSENYPINKELLTPLHIAAIKNDTKSIDILLQDGANIDVQDRNGNTPLIYATIYNCTDAFLLLINNKANFRIRNFQRNSAIWYAMLKKNKVMIKTLVEIGVNINGTEDSFSLLNHFRQKDEDREMFEFLLNIGADIHTPFLANDGSLLHGVIDVSMAERFLELGIDPNAKNVFGETPIFLARNLDIAKLLVQNGADINSISYKGENALHVNTYPEVIEYLLKLGVDMNLRNKDNEPPILSNHDDRVKILFAENGADISISPLGGGTLLHITDNPDLAKILIDRGIDVNKVDNWGQTPLFIAKRKFSHFRKIDRPSRTEIKISNFIELLTLNGAIEKG
jgi:ankyrin repeat protein